jgi:hypothetical protein
VNDDRSVKKSIATKRRSVSSRSLSNRIMTAAPKLTGARVAVREAPAAGGLSLHRRRAARKDRDSYADLDLDNRRALHSAVAGIRLHGFVRYRAEPAHAADRGHEIGSRTGKGMA